MSSKKLFGLIILFSLNMLLTACLANPAIVVGGSPTPVETLILTEPTDEPTATPAPTTPAAETHEPTAPAQPVNTPVPLPTITSLTPVAPHFITTRETAVRVGPGFAYDLSHFLGTSTTVPILGRSADGGWWAIHGPGDGTGPVSWVAGADVTVIGDTSTLPILAAPILPPTPVTVPDVPLIGETGSPPSGRCIVAHPGQTGPINVHLGPGEQFALTARLDVNRWAEAIQEQVGWYEIRLGPGAVGWINGTAIAVNKFC